MTQDPDFSRTVDSDVVRTSTIKKPERLLSLDVLRGLTIAFMIIVNSQMGPAPFFELSHAAWNGFTATDLVFPTFLLLVGLSTVLSTAARLAKGATRRELFLHTLRRAVVLFVAGFVVNNFPFFHLHTVRYYGVLPRIAICYLVVATIYLISPSWKNKVAIAVACLAGYWILLRFVAVPGFGMPTHDLPINDPTGNLTAYIDRKLFSPSHLYERVRDPEGLLSTIPAIATALFGLLAGLWLRSTRSTGRKAAMLAVTGILFLAAGLAWHPFFPMNKKLWTSSFALFAGGWSLLLLAAAIYFIDLVRVGRAAAESNDPASPLHPALYRPLLVFGTNAILAYLVSELGDSVISQIHLPSGLSIKAVWMREIVHLVPNLQWSSLLYSLSFMLLCWLIVLPFYRKRIFLRI
ncbi:acyltransferase family protein [Granulicella arctica]|uniref:acyltransferase family protein n=1 Tax=Granulicella arctica TaxID=940613 RepID=UPI0021E07E36|nr:heparan-alpha-glucosaminide N-acetyltransferase domain-containing protein [Granulicella arctica]